jgi:hypothetical protein
MDADQEQDAGMPDVAPDLNDQALAPVSEQQQQQGHEQPQESFENGGLDKDNDEDKVESDIKGSPDASTGKNSSTGLVASSDSLSFSSSFRLSSSVRFSLESACRVRFACGTGWGVSDEAPCSS